MKRDLYKQLVAWKQSSSRKPLVLKGARQVGKTYILKKFGEGEYDKIAYFNFEEDPDLNEFFTSRLSPEKIIDNLSIYHESRISSDKTLIIFDEIQNSPLTLTSLKYFCENAPEYHIATAGSLLGVKIGQSAPFPVGKVNFLDMYPMSFGEFLDAVGKNQLRLFVEEKQDFYSIPKSFHKELIDFLKIYYFVGGMPEAVCQYIKDKDLKKVRNIQDEILSAYTIDFSKYTTKTEAIRIANIWASIPGQLARENKKFTFKQVNKNARAREYNESIQWLVDAGLVKKVNNIKTAKLPLSGYQDDKFKLYLLDIGLLGAMIKVPQKAIIEGDRLFSEYNGAFVENYVAQEFVAHGQKDLYYWSNKHKAEVDFVVALKNRILPLEVKAGISKQKKSLRVYGEKFKPSVLSRSTLMNFKEDDNFRNYPLYAVSLFLKERGNV
jgi:predicted AAA+ superfamily ATPase